jgi:hypothetical protein
MSPYDTSSSFDNMGVIGNGSMMHERFRHDRISGKLADPNMLWSQEFPKWLQRLNGRREHVRNITGFGGVDSFGYPNKITHARGMRCGHSFNNRSTPPNRIYYQVFDVLKSFYIVRYISLAETQNHF